ncbi:frataxin-like protein [Oligella urethralis]|uniref:iron donor protein CyaY n=1 Tax=Oligella urethralis TaxID=90245 RepID=UPI0006616F54|nr:iron donor protein CyaY [Oligella urethralis]SUA52565.1 frataxin-like protein [Oligella urethralis]SUA56823.1 frataxin-like protein [Oligella urethralis]
MTESEFLALADAILAEVEDQAEGWFDELDLDLDTNLDGQVLTIVFNRSDHLVLNSQSPLQEMWLAAPSGAWHYGYEDGKWVDTRGGPNLDERLSELCTGLAGQKLEVRIP